MLKRISFLPAFLVAALVLVSCGGGTGPIAPPFDPTRPANYDLLFPDKICHWDDSVFPISIYIGPPPAEAGAYGPFMSAAAASATDVWDHVLTGFGDIFEITLDQSQADLSVAWSDMGVSGLTHVVSFPDHVVVDGIFVSKDLRNPDAITLILAHELGHALGLGHSRINYDLMFPSITPGSTTLTTHDEEMLKWLYGKDEYTSIAGL